MVDPLKNKFKHFTFKLYDITGRQDQQYFDSYFDKFKSDPLITTIDWWYDYEAHTGIHVNGVFRSTSYKSVYAKYSAKATKIPNVYLDFHDIPDMHKYNGWIIYCIRRYDTNWKGFLPPKFNKPNILDFTGTQPSTPPNSPSSHQSPPCDLSPSFQPQF